MKHIYKYSAGDVVKVQNHSKAYVIERRYGNREMPCYLIRRPSETETALISEDEIEHRLDGVTEDDVLAGMTTVKERTSEEKTAKQDNANAGMLSRICREISAECPTLSRFGNNFTAKALNGEFAGCFGREDEMSVIEHLMYRRTKPNIMLLGKAGSGKTAIVEGLADIFNKKFINGEIEKPVVIMELCTNAMVGGTKYRGDFEERTDKLLREIESITYVELVLFIDEIHSINELGSSDGSTSLGQVLKPALARGQIKLIGATTTNEYKQYLEKDSALCRRFNIINVEELKGDKAKAISQGILEDYGKFFDIDISQIDIGLIYDNNIKELSGTFPDNLINVIDETLAVLKCDNKTVATMADFGNTLKRYVKTAVKKLGFG